MPKILEIDPWLRFVNQPDAVFAAFQPSLPIPPHVDAKPTPILPIRPPRGTSFEILKWVRAQEQTQSGKNSDLLFKGAKPILDTYPRWAITRATKEAVTINPKPFSSLVDKAGFYILRPFHRYLLSTFLGGFTKDWDESYRQLVEHTDEISKYSTNPKTIHRRLRMGFNIVLGFEKYSDPHLSSNLGHSGNYYHTRELVRKFIVHDLDKWVNLPDNIRTALSYFFLKEPPVSGRMIATNLGINPGTVSRYINAGYNYIRAYGSEARTISTPSPLTEALTLLEGTIYPLITGILKKGVKYSGGRTAKEATYHPRPLGKVTNYWRNRAAALRGSVRPSPSPDTALVTISTDNQPFMQMVSTYQESLMRFTMAYLKDQALASDALQETLEKAYQELPRLLNMSESEKEKWLFNQAKEACSKQNRRSWSTRSWDESIVIYSPRLHSRYDTEQTVLDIETSQEIKDAIGQLDPRHRLIIVGKVIKEIPDDEIITRLELSNTDELESLFDQARLALRQRLIRLTH